MSESSSCRRVSIEGDNKRGIAMLLHLANFKGTTAWTKGKRREGRMVDGFVRYCWVTSMRSDKWNKGLEEKRGKWGLCPDFYAGDGTMRYYTQEAWLGISWWIILDMEDFGRYSVAGWNQESGGQNNVWPGDTETMGVHCIWNRP